MRSRVVDELRRAAKVRDADVWNTPVEMLLQAIQSKLYADRALPGKIHARLRHVGVAPSPQVAPHRPIGPSGVPIVLRCLQSSEFVVGFLSLRFSSTRRDDHTTARADFIETIEQVKQHLREQTRCPPLVDDLDVPSRVECVQDRSAGLAALLAIVLLGGVRDSELLAGESDNETTARLRDVGSPFAWVPFGAWDPSSRRLEPLAPDLLREKAEFAVRLGFRSAFVVESEGREGELAALVQRAGLPEAASLPTDPAAALLAASRRLVPKRWPRVFEQLRGFTDVADFLMGGEEQRFLETRALRPKVHRVFAVDACLDYVAERIQDEGYRSFSSDPKARRFRWEKNVGADRLTAIGMMAFGQLPSRYGSRHDYFARILAINADAYRILVHPESGEDIGYIGVLPITAKAAASYTGIDERNEDSQIRISQFRWDAEHIVAANRSEGASWNVYVHALFVRKLWQRTGAVREALYRIYYEVARLLPATWNPASPPHPLILGEGTSKSGRRLFKRLGWVAYSQSMDGNPIYRFDLPRYARFWRRGAADDLRQRLGHLYLALRLTQLDYLK